MKRGRGRGRTEKKLDKLAVCMVRYPNLIHCQREDQSLMQPDNTGVPKEIEFKLAIIVEPDGDVFHSYCPALKGLHMCGETQEEALQNTKVAATLYLRSLIKHGDPIPVGVAIQSKPKPSWYPAFHGQRQIFTENLTLATT